MKNLNADYMRAYQLYTGGNLPESMKCSKDILHHIQKNQYKATNDHHAIILFAIGTVLYKHHAYGACIEFYKEAIAQTTFCPNTDADIRDLWFCAHLNLISAYYHLHMSAHALQIRTLLEHELRQQPSCLARLYLQLYTIENNEVNRARCLSYEKFYNLKEKKILETTTIKAK